jgi:hypothetical protein
MRSNIPAAKVSTTSWLSPMCRVILGLLNRARDQGFCLAIYAAEPLARSGGVLSCGS